MKIGGNASSETLKGFIYNPNTTSPLVCVYGEGSTGKTSEIFKLVKLGYHLTYLDFNHKPQFNLLPEELWEKVNYIRVKNTPGNDNITEVVNSLSTIGACEICNPHGAKNCRVCGAQDKQKLNLNNLKDTIFVMDELTSYVNLQIEQSETEAIQGTGAMMEEYGILSKKMSKFYNFIAKLPVPSIIIAHEIEVGAEPARAPSKGGPKAGVFYPLAGTTTKSKAVATPRFSHVIRTVVSATSGIGTFKAVQYSRNGRAFANVGSLIEEVKRLPLHEALAVIIGKPPQEEGSKDERT